MQESKDPAIKLFGKKIALPSDGEIPVITGYELQSPAAKKECGKEAEEEKTEEDSTVKATETTHQDDAPPPNIDESGNPEELPELVNPEELPELVNPEELPENNVNPKTPSIDDETAKSKAAKSEKSQNEASHSQEKTLKKPDKILPCPRCNSMDTKFCYYNNYNINQPRHFCKACQRYWTAGGTMRNVPVGAGRRKNKNSASHYRHITISEALQAARIDAPNGIRHPNLKSNGRVLSFGLDAPICDSVASVLNLAEKKVLNSSQNGSHGFQEQEIAVRCRGGENGDDCSSTSSVTVSNPLEDGSRNCRQEPLIRNANCFPSPVPCVPGVPWPYPWNTAVPPPAFCPSGFPMSFYPAGFWNCGIPGTWNMPWFSPSPEFSPNQNGRSSGPNSPTLGKHSRDADMHKPDNTEKEEQLSSKEKNGCVLVPKILRIDDPNEAAKSSIWATLGIKNETISGGGMFKRLQRKSDQKSDMVETSPVLRANPAAFSRSLSFHERT